MTKNKPIYVDGIDVSECEHITYKDSLNPMCGNTGICCYGRKNCYFKQLTRKTQLEERLIKQIRTICDFINNRPEIFKGIYGDVDKIITDYAERKEQECKELQEQLKEMNEVIRTETTRCSLVNSLKTELDQLTVVYEQYKKKFQEFFNTDNQECWNAAFLQGEKAKAEQKLERIGKLCDGKTNKSSFCNGIENKDMQKLAIRILQIINAE